MNITQWLSLLN